jgi:hypothetical protein
LRGRVRVLARTGVDAGRVPVVAGGAAGGAIAAWVTDGRLVVVRELG